MINLKGIILQLDEQSFEKLKEGLSETKAEKFLTLLNLYHQNVLSDEEIMQTLDVKISAFYTLKSRLFDKIQEFLAENLQARHLDLIRQVGSIPDILFAYNKELATAILKKLEKDLMHYDMPYELIQVYKALKKLSVNTPKYYDYSSAYNKTVAYTLNLEKIEEFTSQMALKSAQYALSLQKDYKQEMAFIALQIANYVKVHESHRALIYLNLSQLIHDEENEERAIEILNQSFEILEKYANDNNYIYLKLAFHICAFQIYLKIKDLTQLKFHFYELSKNFKFIFNYHHTIYSSEYLFKRMEYAILTDELNSLLPESILLQDFYQPDISQELQYIPFMIFNALANYYSGNYEKARVILAKLNQESALKNYPHIDIEIKLIFIFLMMITKPGVGLENQLKNVLRKSKLIEDENYEELVSIFVKILKYKNKESEEDQIFKINQLIKQFNQLNTGKIRLLSYLKMDEKFVQLIIKY